MDNTEDLFGDVPQPEIAQPEQRQPIGADDVRDQMIALIDALRSATSPPFDMDQMNKHIAMFPIMAQWLDEEEGEQLVFDFEKEVRRLLKAA